MLENTEETMQSKKQSKETSLDTQDRGRRQAQNNTTMRKQTQIT